MKKRSREGKASCEEGKVKEEKNKEVLEEEKTLERVKEK